MFGKKQSPLEAAVQLTSDALGGFRAARDSLVAANEVFDAEEQAALADKVRIQEEANAAIVERDSHARDCADRWTKNDRVIRQLMSFLGDDTP